MAGGEGVRAHGANATNLRERWVAWEGRQAQRKHEMIEDGGLEGGGPAQQVARQVAR